MSGNDRKARFEDLYKRYYRSIYAYLRGCGFSPDEAKELAQDTFLRVYRSMEQNQYREEAEWSFLKKTARNLALNKIREQKALKRARLEVPFEEMLPLPDPSAAHVDELVEQEESARYRRWLRAAIEKLPDGIRECLMLWLGGLQYKEIAKVMNISMDAVKSRLHEARERLRKLWDEEQK